MCKSNEPHWQHIHVISIDVTTDLCPDGMDAAEGGSCHNCPRGTYRRLGFEEKCIPCIKGWTTLREKSVSESDCTVRK